MESFYEYIDEYKMQLEKGAVQAAYKGLMEYMLSLRNYCQKKYPDYCISGNIYFGYMDMTYFSFFPDSLRQRKLKIAVVLLHESLRFEVWLAGYNKQVQARYWKLFREAGWDKYHVVPSTEGADSIVEHTISEYPDFRDLDKLSKEIEKSVLKFIKDIEYFLGIYN